MFAKAALCCGKPRTRLTRRASPNLGVACLWVGGRGPSWWFCLGFPLKRAPSKTQPRHMKKAWLCALAVGRFHVVAIAVSGLGVLCRCLSARRSPGVFCHQVPWQRGPRRGGGEQHSSSAELLRCSSVGCTLVLFWLLLLRGKGSTQKTKKGQPVLPKLRTLCTTPHVLDSYVNNRCRGLVCPTSSIPL